MRLAWLAASLVAALMLQSGLGLLAPGQARTVDFLLLVVVYCALRQGETTGMLVGAAAGWIQDVHFGGSVLGLSALTRLLVGYAVGAAGARLFLVSSGARILVLFAATVADAWIFAGLVGVFGLPLEPLSAAALTVRGAANAFLGAVGFAAVDLRSSREVGR